MKAFLISIFIIPLLFLASQRVLGQSSIALSFTIPHIALMDIEPAGSNNISITFSIPTEAGSPVTSPTNNNNWINYSSCLAAGIFNSISANISVGSVPAGMELRLLTAAYSGAGTGTFGTSAGDIKLTTTPTSIITGIGGCHTNTGVSSGHQLSYYLNITNYSLLRTVTNNSVTVLYTMTAN